MTEPKVEVAVAQLNTTSLTERARGAILEAILDHRFDERLPPEDQLATMLKVSRTTIRAALQGLEQEGIITRRRALGTTINRHVGPSTLALQRLVGFDWLLRENHKDVTVRTSWTRSPPPADFAAAFGLDPERECVAMEKRYLADGAMALYIRDVVPLANVTGEEFGTEVPASLFEFSKRFCPDPIDHAVVEITSMVMADGVTGLDIAGGEPFTRLHETHYTKTADVVGFSVIDVDDRYIRLEVFRREFT